MAILTTDEILMDKEGFHDDKRVNSSGRYNNY